MTDTILSLQNVTKTFHTKERTFTALNKVNLSIEKGEYLAIIGKSGSGKSTLLNMITGIDFPTQGTIEINGTEIGRMNESNLARSSTRRTSTPFRGASSPPGDGSPL